MLCLTMFPIIGLGEPNIYQNLGDLSINGGYLEFLRLCEELSGGYLEGVQLVSLKKFGSDSQMGYDDGV